MIRNPLIRRRKSSRPERGVCSRPCLEQGESGISDPKSVLRFRREARAAARLHHTNIVPVFDIGERQGIHYYAMQFIQGQGLDEVIRELRGLRGRMREGET